MKKRVFIGVCEIAGYYGQLTRGLREKGYNVTFVGGNWHPFGYKQSKEKQNWLVAFYEKIRIQRARTSRKKIIKKLFYIGCSEVAKTLMFVWAIMKHDTFIFGFGTSFFPRNLDLPVLKLLRKRVICNIGHGSDARPPYIDGAYLSNNGEHLGFDSLYRQTKRISSRCLFIGKYADVVVGAPLTSQFLNVKYVNHFQIGLPFKKEDSQNESSLKSGAVRILHSPSHPQGKGTPKIRDTINSLKKKGYDIKWVEVIGQPNSVVLEELSLCDFVVDQLYSDTPMAGFATEAAWFGKPAVVGGYGWELLKKVIPPGMFPPSQICHPDHLEEAIEQLIADEKYRTDLGNEAYRFVREKWSVQQIAERYIRLIEGDFPKEWYINPDAFIYLLGGCLSESRVKEIVSKLISVKGVKALQLSEKPALERAFLEFALSEEQPIEDDQKIPPR